MHGLKNLLPNKLLADENFVTLQKKSDEYKKAIGNLINHLELINKVYENYYSSYQKSLSEVTSEFQAQEGHVSKFYNELSLIFMCINNELRKFIEHQTDNQKEILQLNNLFMNDYSVLMQSFALKAKEYNISENNLTEMCKKYFKSFKNMINNIQLYKNSFIDVKVIYNKDEKIKRYNQCVANYKLLEEDLAIINKKVEEVNKNKSTLSQSYKILQKQFTNFTVSIANKYITQLKQYYESFVQLQKNSLSIFTEGKNDLDNLPISIIFTKTQNNLYQQYLDCPINKKQTLIIPSFFKYAFNLTEEGLALFPKMITSYYSELCDKMQRRKNINKKMVDYMQRYVKSLDKVLIDSINQILLNFQKIRKRIGEVFGNRWIAFYKIIISIFENYVEVNGRFQRNIVQKIKGIQSAQNLENSVFQSLSKDFRAFLEKSLPKKLLKKYLNQKIQSNLGQQEKAMSRLEIQEKSLIGIKLIESYTDKLTKATEGIKNSYCLLMNDLKLQVCELYTHCQEIHKSYFENDDYEKNFKLCIEDILSSIQKEMKFFEQLPIGTVKDNSVISFDSQFNKIEGFKKIKKPKELEDALKVQSKSNEEINFESSRETHLTEINNDQNLKIEAEKLIKKEINREEFLGQNAGKHAELLFKKIQFQENQKYIKSASCGLTDKIILMGRLFVTTHRICFYSKFNPRKFLGETFIQIPKNDIQKIQKRTNGLFFDNSISITTVNGEMFFTSFFARNKMFDLLKKTFLTNADQIFFEEQENLLEQQIVEVQQEFEDDMKQEMIPERSERIKKYLKPFKYTPIFETQFVFPDLTPLKFLKLFDLDQQVTINRLSYLSFTHFYKDFCANKDINIEKWNPNPFEFINIINIKESTPDIFTKKISAVVPLPPSSIPFMPKVTTTTEEHNLFIISKDLILFESMAKNHGIPYCDNFDIRFLRTIQTIQPNKIRMKVDIYVNFIQNCMVRATIQAKTLEGSKSNYESFAIEIKNYLKNLEKKFKPAGGKKQDSITTEMNELKELVGDLENEKKKLQQKNKGYLAQIENLKKSQKIFKFSSLALVVLCLLLFLLFMTQ